MTVVALHLKYAIRALLTWKRADRESGHASPDEGRHVRLFRRRGENDAWESVSLLPHKAHLLSSTLEYKTIDSSQRTNKKYLWLGLNYHPSKGQSFLVVVHYFPLGRFLRGPNYDSTRWIADVMCTKAAVR